MNKTLFVLLFAAVSNAAVLGADSGASSGGDGELFVHAFSYNFSEPVYWSRVDFLYIYNLTTR